MAGEAAPSGLRECLRTERSGVPHREDIPPDAGLPIAPFASILEGQKVLLPQPWTYANAKNAAGVRESLSKDMRFWRHTLEHSDFLITKMIAVAALKRDFKLG